MRALVAIDWDDTLVDFNRGFVRYHNEMHGSSLSYEGIFSHLMREVYGCEEEVIAERCRVFRNSPGFSALEPMEGAAEALQLLRHRYDLDIVTNRMETLRDATIEVAERLFGNPFREFHFANGFATEAGFVKRLKSDVCRAIAPAVLIEDAVVHAKDVASLGIPVLMPDRPWNRKDTPAGVIRVDSWEQAVAWIDKNV